MVPPWGELRLAGYHYLQDACPINWWVLGAHEQSLHIDTNSAIKVGKAFNGSDAFNIQCSAGAVALYCVPRRPRE